MKIKNVHLIDFKRFTELTITDIPETTRLVILVGPNGSGKSSLFDAFNTLGQAYRGSPKFSSDYHIKAGRDWDDSDKVSTSGWYLVEKEKIDVNFYDAPKTTWYDSRTVDSTKFYVRTSYRYEPEFAISSISKQGDIIKDDKQPEFLSSIENKVSKNYQRLIADTIASIYDNNSNDNITKREIRGNIIGSINSSFQRILHETKFTGLGNPLINGTLFFEKGQSKNWPYKNLSAGEKATFDLILDFTIKSKVYTDTIYCIDEPEVHINTNVHSALLEELYTALPEKSQLWIATHSAGMMRKARELESDNPGTVVFLDFGSHDFDQPAILKPAITDRAFWQRNFSIALGEMADLVAPTQIFFCEGDPNGVKRKEFDARCYTALFANEFPDAVFLSVGSSNEVKDKSNLLSGVFSQFLPSVITTYVVDRDDCTEEERAEIIEQGNRILRRRHLEAYLLDPSILQKLCVTQLKPDVWPILEAEIDLLYKNSVEGRGNPIDDWKSIGEQIRTTAKKLLSIPQIGSNADAFMLNHLVPLVIPDTKVYQDLKHDIFG